MKRYCLLAAAAVLALAGTGRAAPLDPASVPANAKWVAHLDFDAARSSTVVHKFMQDCGKDLPGFKEKFGKLGHALGIDPRTDLRGATVFGTEHGPHHAVLVLRGKFNASELKEKVEKAPDHKTVDYGSLKIHTFIAHHGKKHAHEVAAVLFKPDVLVITSEVKRLEAAIDVLGGKGATLASKSSSVLAAKAPEGAVFLLRGIDLKDSKAAKWHPALELVKSFSYDEGQHDGKWFGNLAINADSKSVAGKLGRVLDGYRAWLSLHGHKSPWFEEMLNRIKLNVEGDNVKVAFLEPADTLISHMPEICKAIHEHMEFHMKMMHMHARMMEKMHHHGEKSAEGKAPACCPKCPMEKKKEAAPGAGAKK